ncbi:MAG: hypothetical protein KF862_11685 [Chitinophagaceae bacterium]|nr:hypothetical protein [Chitinophagaceae bacterium]
MANPKTTYRSKHYASCVFMMLTLLWLTVSAPFIMDMQKKLHDLTSSSAGSPQSQSMEEAANPFSGLNEEKCSGGNTLSEYLHEPLALAVPLDVELIHASRGGTAIYIAYCGELLSPPPEL